MNEEELSIDVQAETKMFADVITPSELKESDPASAQRSADLPESIPFSQSIGVELPESIPITPTKFDIDKDAVAEVANVNIGLSVKFDAEQEIRSVKASIDDVEAKLSDTMNSVMPNWIPDPKAASKFEERATTDPTNLVFEARRERFSQYPRWA